MTVRPFVLDPELFPAPAGLPRKSGPRLATLPPPRARDDERFSAREANADLGRVIAVTGSSSNAGKTWLAEACIGALRRRGRPLTALKVTRTHLGECPRRNDGCGTCDDLTRPFEIVTDPVRLGESGKDTARYRAAGANQVLWLLTNPYHTAAGLRAALTVVRAGSDLVAEGNSFRDFVAADVTMMALTCAHDVKPSANHIRDRVDVFVVREHQVRDAFVAALERCGLADARIECAATWEAWLPSLIAGGG